MEIFNEKFHLFERGFGKIRIIIYIGYNVGSGVELGNFKNNNFIKRNNYKI